MSGRTTCAPVVAVDVGGTSIKSGTFTESGEQLWSSRVPTPRRSPAALQAAILQAVDDAVAATEAVAGCAPRAIGAAVLGLVDDAAGIARRSAAVGWTDVPLRDLIVARTGLATFVTQDLRAGLLAELTYGPGRTSTPLLYVALGTGVGGALAIQGQLVPGARGNAGEIGHIRVVEDGRVCGCGNRGCLETEASGSAISRNYAELTGTSIDARAVAMRAIGEDADALEAWSRAATGLAKGLAIATALLDPELIVLGGGVALAGDLLLQPVRRAVAEHYVLSEPPPITLTTLGDRGAMLGAAIAGRRLAADG